MRDGTETNAANSGSAERVGLRGIVGFMTLVWGKVLGSLRKNDSKK